MRMLIVTWLDLASLVGAVTVFGAIVYWLYSTLTDRNPDAPSRTDSAIDRRLAMPDYDGVRAYFNTDIPAELLWLYAQRELLSRRRVAVITDTGESHTIDHFLPLSVSSIRDAWYPIGERRVPIAIDEVGNYLVVPVDGRGEHTPVFYIDHDGGAVWQIGSSVRILLERSTSAAAVNEETIT